MEIINKNHRRIREFTPYPAYMRILEKQITFNAQLCPDYGIKAGGYVHFGIEKNCLYFFQNEDPSGFRLHKITGDSCGCKVNNKALVETIVKKLKLKGYNHRFSVIDTNREHQGAPILEVIISNPLDPNWKRNKSKLAS